MTMAYIIALNPNILTGFDVGSPLWNGVFLATYIASAIGMFVMAFAANKLAIIILSQKGIKAAVIVGMLIASVVNWAGQAIFLHTNPFTSLTMATFVPPFKDMASTTLFQYNFKGFAEIGWFTVITLIVTFCIIDMFDTIGTLVGTASRAGMLDKDGKMPKMKQALLADAVGTVVGSATGTSTVTAMVESASGVNVHFDDISESLPVARMLLAMPVSDSIGYALDFLYCD